MHSNSTLCFLADVCIGMGGKRWHCVKESTECFRIPLEGTNWESKFPKDFWILMTNFHTVFSIFLLYSSTPSLHPRVLCPGALGCSFLGQGCKSPQLPRGMFQMAEAWGFPLTEDVVLALGRKRSLISTLLLPPRAAPQRKTLAELPTWPWLWVERSLGKQILVSVLLAGRRAKQLSLVCLIVAAGQRTLEGWLGLWVRGELSQAS